MARGHRGRPGVDWQGLRRVVEAGMSQCGAFPGAVHVDGKLAYISDGMNHDSYRFGINVPGDDRAFILRLPTHRGGNRSKADAAASIDREARTLAALTGLETDFEVPEVICRLGDRPGFVETVVAGVPVRHLKGTPHARLGVETIGKLAARVHALPVLRFSHLSAFPDAVAHVKHALAEATTEAVCQRWKVAGEARAWIEDSMPVGRPSVLLHGDLLPQNVLYPLVTDGPVGLVDWEFAQVGDAAYDLAIVTRSNRKVLGVGGAMKILLDNYAAEGGQDLTARDVHVHELILLLNWLRESVEQTEQGGHGPDYYEKNIRSLLRRAEKYAPRPVACNEEDDVAEEPGAPRHVKIYTDGGANPNPGSGGYGVVLLYREHRKELTGGYRLTTNNRMEILAAIRGLEALKEPCRVTLHTDSQYLANAVSKGWARRWRANNWMRNRDEAAKNPDLWGQLLDLCDYHDVTFKWVRGHADDRENNRCDALATAARQRPDLPSDPGFVTPKVQGSLF